MRVFPAVLALAMSVSAERFVRFISDDGQIYTGDAILSDGTTDASKSTSARVIQGDIFGNFTVTQEIKNITTLLAPMAPEKTRTVRCVGFNYAAHAEEANITIPDFPILFFKPWTALAPPNGQVPVTEGYQTQGNFTSEMDYESELVVVISKAAYNITVDQALDHVLGYASGYDVSHRGWQIDRGGLPQPQFSMGKDADGWAPWGPAIVTKDIIPNPQNLSIFAKVNGVTMQNDTTANMLFGVADLVSFFSMGITLLPGDIIYTGTPSGVQLGKADPVWLVDGDVVEVGLEGLGTCTSTITDSNATESAFDPILGFTGVKQ
ncbi:MAG: hypothetical protein NXY57DRAFT_10477 [Lentinula lateritia]|uniref:Fumarylacetoacetase-like C-terminal domain-containing protein n=1 Tax=Lentinula lateritia TaxID=40482 RepID=A0ABQ8VYZ8_9AGAR|nr:MAG: hypothetical protein NXY57DRAFT_10477 [Lentinula lateritia]KAJ4501545.1 hypothetical protein C8R41DRAFT_892196 [Lentinula lateritia]